MDNLTDLGKEQLLDAIEELSNWGNVKYSQYVSLEKYFEDRTGWMYIESPIHKPNPDVELISAYKDRESIYLGVIDGLKQINRISETQIADLKAGIIKVDDLTQQLQVVQEKRLEDKCEELNRAMGQIIKLERTMRLYHNG